MPDEVRRERQGRQRKWRGETDRRWGAGKMQGEGGGMVKRSERVQGDEKRESKEMERKGGRKREKGKKRGGRSEGMERTRRECRGYPKGVTG